MQTESSQQKQFSIEEEAERMNNSPKLMSDGMNNSPWLQYLIACMGLVYIVYHFITRGFDVNLNIMIFILSCLACCFTVHRCVMALQ